MKYKLTIEYDGSSFFGWQRQKNNISVQGTIEKSLSLLCHENILVVGAGRTDTGVHATGQVAHFSCNKNFNIYKLIQGINHNVGELPVSVINAEIVPDDFHAISSAKSRTYIYKIINRFQDLTFQKKLYLKINQHLDEHLMNKAAKFLIGKHDFSSFRSAKCQSKSPIKIIFNANVIRNNEEINLIFEGNSFLHHQIRNMVGALIYVGYEKWSINKFIEIFNKKDRNLSAPMVPPDGLYLTEVKY